LEVLHVELSRQIFLRIFVAKVEASTLPNTVCSDGLRTCLRPGRYSTNWAAGKIRCWRTVLPCDMWKVCRSPSRGIDQMLHALFAEHQLLVSPVIATRPLHHYSWPSSLTAWSVVFTLNESGPFKCAPSIPSRLRAVVPCPIPTNYDD
jgi:hypothetical protein